MTEAEIRASEEAFFRSAAKHNSDVCSTQEVNLPRGLPRNATNSADISIK